MALIELNLEKPALKRTETAESSAKKSTTTTPAEEPVTETSGADTGTTVEVPEGEPAEEESAGGGMLRRIAVLGATVGAVFALRQWRSRRKQRAGEPAEFEEEWETPRSE